jgi:hypothetical protein
MQLRIFDRGETKLAAVRLRFNINLKALVINNYFKAIIQNQKKYGT